MSSCAWFLYYLLSVVCYFILFLRFEKYSLFWEYFQSIDFSAFLYTYFYWYFNKINYPKKQTEVQKFTYKAKMSNPKKKILYLAEVQKLT